MIKSPSVSPKLQSQIKKCDLKIQKFIAALESEISDLDSENAQLEAENLRLRNRIKRQKAEIDDCTQLRENPSAYISSLSTETLKELRQAVRNKKEKLR